MKINRTSNQNNLIYSITLNDLYPNTRYMIEVQTVNEDGSLFGPINQTILQTGILRFIQITFI